MSEPIINQIDVRSIFTKSNLPVGEYSVNTYVGCTHRCKYCYASFMKRFTGHTEPWGTFLDVKNWPEIKDPKKYAGKELFIGSVTDPYLPQEKIYERTRALLIQLKGSGAKISIATKSDLILRDLDLIKTFRTPVFRGLSIHWTRTFSTIWIMPSVSRDGLQLWRRFTAPVSALPALSLPFFPALPT